MDDPTLFDSSAPFWIESPNIAFQAWISRHQMKRKSMTVYIYMWGKFSRWLSEKKIRLNECGPQDIGRFLDESGLAKRQRYHYVRLIERVFGHLLALKGFGNTFGNPGSLAAQQRIGTGHNDPMAFLSPRERAALVEEVEKGVEKQREGELCGQAGKWKAIRDRAIVGILLGGGLKVHEVGSLTLSCILSDGLVLDILSNSVGGGSSAPATIEASRLPRQVKLMDFAVASLSRWILTRADGTAGDVLFPSNKKGLQMDPSSIFRRVKVILAAAGVTSDEFRTCCQTLRNTFVATLLDRDTPPEDIMALLGFREILTVERIRYSYESFKHNDENIDRQIEDLQDDALLALDAPD